MGKAEIAQRIKAARISKGLTQADVARSLGLTPQAISNFERGKNRISNENLRALCELYDISADIVLDNMLRGKPVIDEKGQVKINYDYPKPVRSWVRKSMDFTKKLYEDLDATNPAVKEEFLVKVVGEVAPNEIEFFLAEKLYESKQENQSTLNLILDALPDDNVLRIQNTKTTLVAMYRLKTGKLD